MPNDLDQTMGDDENPRYGKSNVRYHHSPTATTDTYHRGILTTRVLTACDDDHQQETHEDSANNNNNNNNNIDDNWDDHDHDVSSTSSSLEELEEEEEDQDMAAGDDRVAEEQLWADFIAHPPDQKPRVLCFPHALSVNEQSLDRFINWMTDLPEHERPIHFQLLSERISDTLGTAYRLDQLLELCKESLRYLDVHTFQPFHGFSDQEHPRIPYAKQVYSEVLGSTVYLKYLVKLRIHATNLSRPSSLSNRLAQFLSSKNCHIQSLQISDCKLQKIDGLASALERYEGLQELRFRRCGLSQSELHVLIESLENSQSRLTHLDLSFNRLDNSILPRLSSMITAQRNLLVLQLRNNPLFQRIRSENGVYYEYCNDDTGFLQVALSVHTTLQELVLADCDMDHVAFQALLTALTVNTSLRTLDLRDACDMVRIDSGWVDLLPSLKTLRCLYGLDHLTRKKKWESLVAPVLRKNMALTDLAKTEATTEAATAFPHGDHIYDDNRGAYDDDLLFDDEDGDLIMFDRSTTHTLARNRSLHRIEQFNIHGDPPLGVWPVLLEKFAARGMEESPLFWFLHTKSANLQASSWLSSSSCHGVGWTTPSSSSLSWSWMKGNKKRSVDALMVNSRWPATAAAAVEEENRLLYCRVQELEHENFCLRWEKARRILHQDM